jgi:hypothetical protein
MKGGRVLIYNKEPPEQFYISLYIKYLYTYILGYGVSFLIICKVLLYIRKSGWDSYYYKGMRMGEG